MKTLNAIFAGSLAFAIGFLVVSGVHLVAAGVMTVLCLANVWAACV